MWLVGAGARAVAVVGETRVEIERPNLVHQVGWMAIIGIRRRCDERTDAAGGEDCARCDEMKRERRAAHQSASDCVTRMAHADTHQRLPRRTPTNARTRAQLTAV